MVSDTSELDTLVETVRAAGPSELVEPFAAELADAVAGYRAPIRVQVAGRAGVGKSTVIAALGLPADSETTAVDDPAGPDPVLDGDVVVYVLAAAPTAADRAALAAAPAALVVLNKADALAPGWPAAVHAAAAHSADLGTTVLPLVGSLAERTRESALTPAEASSLGRLARVPDATLALSPELFLAVQVGTDVRARRSMLERWDLYGICCALAALRRDPQLPAAPLTQLLHAASGLDAVAAALAGRLRDVAGVRGGELLDAVVRLAARALPEQSTVRAELETFLRGDLAARVGLAAGLACPDIAHLAAEHRAPEAADPTDALYRADRWRELAAHPELSPAAQRAARRIHQGYLRAWERMSFGAGTRSAV